MKNNKENHKFQLKIMYLINLRTTIISTFFIKLNVHFSNKKENKYHTCL